MARNRIRVQWAEVAVRDFEDLPLERLLRSP
jgi:hypothetical protein